MDDFITYGNDILRLLEADLPPADDKEDNNEGDEDAAGDQQLPQDDQPAADQTPPPPPAQPVELASTRECIYTDAILSALMYDFDKVPTKALVVFDLSNPEQILHAIQKLTGKRPSAKDFEPKGEVAAAPVQPGEVQPMLHRQKQILAQMMLKALKYDSKQLSVDSGIATDRITPQTAKQLQKELSILLAV